MVKWKVIELEYIGNPRIVIRLIHKKLWIALYKDGTIANDNTLKGIKKKAEEWGDKCKN